ncbi:DUF6168 family protein [Dokdonia sp. R86516]|uniref:DUF6168 family protein n=1 Tax=Dokdonia sp. R86516 TaxID=3093856 RepID=UPI0037C7DE0C
MIKKILLYVAVAVATFFISYSLHNYILISIDNTPPYNLRDVYIFHLSLSLFIVLLFELIIYFLKEFKDQIGFLYLGSIVLKMMLFFVIFRELLSTSLQLSKTDKLSLLIPIAIFIIYEVMIVVKMLNRAD